MTFSTMMLYRMTPNIKTCRIMTISRMSFRRRKTLSRIAPNRMAFSIMIVNRMEFSRKTFRTETTQQNDT